MPDKWCIDCGLRYDYQSTNPLGATTTHCPSCQKKSSRKGKKFDLMLLAGAGEIKCRACNFKKYPYAIKMIPGILDRVVEVSKEKDAEQSYLLCLNCAAALDSGDIKVKVININSRPIELAIWDTKVSVVETPIEQHVRSSDAIELEVVTHGQSENPIRNVSAKIPRVEGSGA